jgi:NADPH-dependent 2,4-dienoyl-CoA reductase/sulfur reductase-like enzyme
MNREAPLVVVGASLAGLRAVQAARKTGFDGPITLVGAETHLPYDRPPLSKAFLAAGTGPLETTLLDRASLDQLNVTLRLGVPATGLDVANHELKVGTDRLPYRAVVLATGASARNMPGEQPAGVHTLRTVEDARAVRAALDAGARTVVIGAGFIGSEVASAAAARGLAVTVVEAAPLPLVRAVGSAMAHALAALHASHGVELLCGTAVKALLGQDRVTGVELADGSTRAADVVVVGIGSTPTTGWLADSGLDTTNGVCCDRTLRAADDVYAAGDVARWHNPIFDTSMRLEHWTSAAEQGAAAARNALNPESATPYGCVPYFWSDWYGQRLQMVGIPEADEVHLVGGPTATQSRSWTALYRTGDHVTGALTLNLPGRIMKYKARIAAGATWSETMLFAEAPTPGRSIQA